LISLDTDKSFAFSTSLYLTYPIFFLSLINIWLVIISTYSVEYFSITSFLFIVASFFFSISSNYSSLIFYYYFVGSFSDSCVSSYFCSSYCSSILVPSLSVFCFNFDLSAGLGTLSSNGLLISYNFSDIFKHYLMILFSKDLSNYLSKTYWI